MVAILLLNEMTDARRELGIKKITEPLREVIETHGERVDILSSHTTSSLKTAKALIDVVPSARHEDDRTLKETASEQNVVKFIERVSDDADVTIFVADFSLVFGLYVYYSLKLTGDVAFDPMAIHAKGILIERDEHESKFSFFVIET